MGTGEGQHPGQPPEGSSPQRHPHGTGPAEQAAVTGIGTGILFACLLASVAILVAQGQAGRLWLTVPFAVNGAWTVYLLRTGRLELGVRVGIGGTWVATLLSLCVVNGVRGPSVSAFAALILLAGWHIGPRAAVWLTSATVAALVLLAHAGASGWPLPVTIEATPWYNGLVHSGVMLATGTVSFYAARAMKGQFRDLKTSRAELRRKVRELAAHEAELEETQARLLELNTDLEARVRQRTEDLQLAMRDLEAFTATVSHDLRSPLRIVHGHLGALREAVPEPGEDAEESLAAIGRGVEQMNGIVEGLLRLARVSRGELELATVDMNAVLARLLEDVRPTYPKAEIVVDELPAARGDPTLIGQVLANLVGNALKYSSREEQPEVHVGWSEEERAWFVRDNGVGFDMSQASRLFENFARLHRADEFEGTGVGLSLVKKIVERHGGRIWALAEPGEGAAFYFQLGRGQPA